MAAPPVAPQRAGTPRNRRKRLWLAMGLGIVALLCLGGVGVVVSLYDGATEIKRSAPDAVVDNFLGAYLVNRDDKEAALYRCKNGGDFDQIEAYRTDIMAREKNFSVGISVSWTSLTVATNGDHGTVTTDLTKGTADGSERVTKPWQFTVVDQDGWRVCGARPLT
jgi:hypothetical protein